MLPLLLSPVYLYLYPPFCLSSLLLSAFPRFLSSPAGYVSCSSAVYLCIYLHMPPVYLLSAFTSASRYPFGYIEGAWLLLQHTPYDAVVGLRLVHAPSG